MVLFAPIEAVCQLVSLKLFVEIRFVCDSDLCKHSVETEALQLLLQDRDFSG